MMVGQEDGACCVCYIKRVISNGRSPHTLGSDGGGCVISGQENDLLW